MLRGLLFLCFAEGSPPPHFNIVVSRLACTPAADQDVLTPLHVNPSDLLKSEPKVAPHTSQSPPKSTLSDHMRVAWLQPATPHLDVIFLRSQPPHTATFSLHSSASSAVVFPKILLSHLLSAAALFVLSMLTPSHINSSAF